MGKRTKTISFNVISMIVIYVIFASIETVKLSSKTVDEAFEKFKNEFVQTEIGDEEFYRIGNSTFVPFEVGNTVSLVQFEKGIFGWKPTYYFHDEDRGSSYTSFADGDILTAVEEGSAEAEAKQSIRESFGVENGGSVEMFETNEGAEKRKEYIETVMKEMGGLLAEYTYMEKNVLLRLSKSLTPDQAATYETALKEIIK